MVSRPRLLALAIVFSLGGAATGHAAGTALTAGAKAGTATHAPAPAAATPGRSDAPTISQDAAARARMHECAHQWSAIKKAGNAGTTTWKEFSATCLVVSK